MSVAGLLRRAVMGAMLIATCASAQERTILIGSVVNENSAEGEGQ